MDDKKNEKARIPVTVRVPGHILQDIDSCVDNEEVPVSRNHWIVDALIEKLKRTRNGTGADGTR